MSLRHAALALLLAALPGCGGEATGAAEHPAPGSTDAIAVRVAPAERATLADLYATSATLRPEKQATVTARATGVVERLLVEEGDDVAEGAPLAQLDRAELALEHARAVAVRETREREYARARALAERGVLGEDALETARRTAEEARHAAALAELRLERTTVRAPFAGRVLRRFVDVGTLVSQGTPIVDVADLDPLHGDVEVPERHVGRLAPGQTVRLVADATASVVAARIDRIAPAVDPTTGTVTVTVAVDGGVALRPGTFVRVHVVTDSRSDVLTVPRAALVSAGRGWVVFRVGGDGRAEEVPVRPGFEEGDRVEVLASSGSEGALAPGERVVVLGASALSDGAPVRVEGEAPARADGDP